MEIVGLIKAIENSKHIGRLAQRTIILEVMRHIDKHELADSLRDVILSAQPLFDDALLWHFTKLRTSMLEKAFISTAKPLMSLLMCRDDIVAVERCNEKWEGVAAQVSRLTRSSNAGSAIYAHIRDSLASVVLKNELSTSLDVVIAADFSDQSLLQFHRAHARFAAAHSKHAVVDRRVIVVKICAMEGKMEITSVAAESDL